MMSLSIMDTDAFLDMPMSSQALYFHLLMRADDEGFIGNPKKIMRMIGSQDDDLKVLIIKRFILAFESGIVVIKHWLIHNNIRTDRIQETTYKKEKETLKLNEYEAYTEDVRQVSDKSQHSIDKISIDKGSIDTPKISKLIVDTLLKETGINVPDGDYIINNLFPAKRLAKKIAKSFEKDGKKDVTDEQIISAFIWMLKEMDTFHKNNSTSISYIEKNYNKIINSIKKDGHK